MNLVGGKYEQLTVLEVLAPPQGQKNSLLRVLCTCGAKKLICRTTWGISKSCGCTIYTRGHGRSGSAEYRAWLSMWSRCNNPADAAFNDYGGRGIRICARWKSFAAFLFDVGPKPSPSHRLDRRKVNKNYTPGNVLWVDVQTSNLNKRNAVVVTWKGERHFLKDVAALYGVPYRSALWRLRAGWPLNRVLGVNK